MKFLRICLFTLLLTGILIGCASKAYYDAAQATKSRSAMGSMEYVMLCLQKDATNQQAKSLKQQLNDETPKQLMAKAQAHENAGEYDKAVAAYDRLAAFAAISSLQIEGLPTKREDAVNKAAAAFYSKATGLCQEQMSNIYTLEKDKAQQGGKWMRTALAFSPGYKDGDKWYKAFRSIGTLRIVVNTFQNEDMRFPNLGQNLASTTLARLMERHPEFLEFLTREQLKALVKEQMFQEAMSGMPGEADAASEFKGADYFIRGRILSIIPTDSGWLQTDYKDSVKVPLYGKNEKGKTVKVGEETVTAQWTVSKKETSLALKSSYEVVSVQSSQIRKQGSLNKNTMDSYSYLSYFNGDERALPSDVKNLPTEMREPMNHEQLAERLVEELSQQFAKDLFAEFMAK